MTGNVAGQNLTSLPAPFPFQEVTIPHLRTRIYQSNLTEIKKYSENSSYTSYLTSYLSDGLKINALFTVPKGNPPEDGWPGVVFVHGYIPPAQYKTTTNYSSFVDGLARSGIIVFKIDLRGHGTSDGDAGGGYYSSDYVIDTLNAFEALKQTPSINPQNISLWGHSMSGNIVFRSLVANPSINKVVIWAGAVYTYEDMKQFRITDASYRPLPANSPSQKKRQQLFDLYGQFDPNSDFWKQVVPTNYLDEVVGRIQLHHAVNDNVVNVGYSRNLIKILESSTISHQLFEYPSGGHNLTGSSFSQAIKRTADFIRSPN